MRRKFKIMYPTDHADPALRGKMYKPPKNCMIVMNSDGIFFLYNGETYYPSITKLSRIIPVYDVVWE